jgi:hypothetical protein
MSWWLEVMLELTIGKLVKVLFGGGLGKPLL